MFLRVFWGACFARSRRAWEPVPRLLCGSPRSNATNAVPPPMCPRVPCAMFAACQGRVRAATFGARIPGRRAL
eukprot:1795294-Prymnesium_polylepis.1